MAAAGVPCDFPRLPHSTGVCERAIGNSATLSPLFTPGRKRSRAKAWSEGGGSEVVARSHCSGHRGCLAAPRQHR